MVEHIPADEKLSSAESNGRMPVHAVLSDGMHAPYDGITKRELFAAMAMQGIVTGIGTYGAPTSRDGSPITEAHIAQQAIEFADVLLKELAK